MVPYQNYQGSHQKVVFLLQKLIWILTKVIFVKNFYCIFYSDTFFIFQNCMDPQIQVRFHNKLDHIVEIGVFLWLRKIDIPTRWKFVIFTVQLLKMTMYFIKYGWNILQTEIVIHQSRLTRPVTSMYK